MNDQTRTERQLLRLVGRAIEDFHLIEEGDRVAVALSGGKDSYGMLHLLEILRKRAPVRFELVALHLDQAQPGYDGTPLVNWLQTRELPYHILHRDTYSVVKEKVPEGKTYCSLCSRMRRGILYDAVQELRCNKLALGHHRDDTIETLMLNLVFSGQLKAMPPKLRSDDGRNTVIRPLTYCGEDLLRKLSEEQRFPILPCNLCGSQDNMQRQNIKKLLSDLEVLHPRLKESMLAALGNVRPSHLLDAGLWKKLDLAVAEEKESVEEHGLDWSFGAFSADDEILGSGRRTGEEKPKGLSVLQG